jgi:ribosomal-protein-alanine N-acetyltransferase
MAFADWFKTVPVLETPRLTLRPFCLEDIEAYLRMVRDPEVCRYLGGGLSDLPNERHVANWLRNINGRLLQSKTVFTWCIERKEDKSFVGRIDLGGFVRKLWQIWRII